MAGPFRAGRRRLPYSIVRGRDQTLSLSVGKAGAVAVVVSGKITIRNEDGTAVVDGVAIVVGSAGEATYALLAASVPDTQPYSCGWSIDWDLVFSDGAQLFTRSAFLLRRELEPVIDAEDIVGEKGRHPELSADEVITVAQTQPFVDMAWVDLMSWLLEDGHPPHKTLSPEALGETHSDWSCHRLFAHLATYATGSAGHYATERDRYETAARANYGRLRMPRDADEDGVPDGVSIQLPPLYGVEGNVRGGVAST